MLSGIAVRCSTARAFLAGMVLASAGWIAAEPASAAEVVVESVKPPQANGKFGLTHDDYQALSQTLGGAQYVVPLRWMTQPAIRRSRELEIQLVGTTAEFAAIDQRRVAQGRFLNVGDVQDRHNVAVLDALVARRLFGSDDPIGQNIRVGGQYFLVVGVLGRPAKTTSPRENSKSIYIPWTTMRIRYGDQQVATSAGLFERQHYELSQIRVVLEDPDSIEPTMEVLRSLLNKSHERQDYSIRRAVESTEPVPN